MSRRYASPRFFSAAVVFAIAFGCLVARLAWVQVVRADHWRERAQHTSTRTVAETAERGRILDRNGDVLAVSENWMQVGVSNPRRFRSQGKVGRLAPILGVSPDTVERGLATDDRHAVLGEFRIDAGQRESLRHLPAVTLDPRVRRVRYHGDMAVALLGNVGLAGEGRTGLEARYDETLRGRPGRVLMIRDGDDNVRERRALESPVPGGDLLLTLDPHVQALVESELETAREAASAAYAQAIVMDPRDGSLLAIAQVPAQPGSGDPDEPVGRWRVVSATDVFEPGSVAKIFTAASLLQRDVADTSTVFDGLRDTTPDGRRASKHFGRGKPIRDVHPVGRVSLRHGFVRSSNIVFATAAHELLEPDEQYDDLRRFGFGQHSGLALPGESAGILRSPEHALWTMRTQATLAIGQAMAVTGLQLASAASAVLGDGTLYRPRLVHAIRHADGREEVVPPVIARRGVVHSEVAAAVRAMCVDVVEEPSGTGTRAAVPGITVGGKTGTAQVSARSGGYLDGLYNSTFIGFAPADDPRLVVVIVLHRAVGKSFFGGQVAAPAFSAIVREIAATTRLLDRGLGEPIAPVAAVSAPDLVGRSVAEIRELAERAAWGRSLPSLPGAGHVVGQLPLPGTPIHPGAAMQLAFDRGFTGGTH